MRTTIDKNGYCRRMAESLVMLRAKLGLTQEKLCRIAGISRQTVVQAEHTGKLSWSTYLTLVFIFSRSRSTMELMEFLQIYPREFDLMFDEPEQDPEEREV